MYADEGIKHLFSMCVMDRCSWKFTITLWTPDVGCRLVFYSRQTPNELDIEHEEELERAFEIKKRDSSLLCSIPPGCHVPQTLRVYRHVSLVSFTQC
ncbi:hypothetical protein Baya_6244 [Bagarius yarrelli]|uniref:Uncharacterized protein n=1 Tax=Bagarius yarrelli TaxID=175774 RepID=A0A556U009_BAGYA|nr:hypothetical protein Baya_6244 [Bagarius yarrelli]